MAKARHYTIYSSSQRAMTATRALFSRLLESVRSYLSQGRPWQQLIADCNSFRIPESVTEARSRVRKNWAYFRVNYFILLFLVIALCLLSRPVSLFLIVVLLGMWMFLYLLRSEPLVVVNRSYSDRDVLVIMTILTIVVLFAMKDGLLVLRAFMVLSAFACTHGVFRVPVYDDDVFLKSHLVEFRF